MRKHCLWDAAAMMSDAEVATVEVHVLRLLTANSLGFDLPSIRHQVGEHDRRAQSHE